MECSNCSFKTDGIKVFVNLCVSHTPKKDISLGAVYRQNWCGSWFFPNTHKVFKMQETTTLTSTESKTNLKSYECDLSLFIRFGGLQGYRLHFAVIIDGQLLNSFRWEDDFNMICKNPTKTITSTDGAWEEYQNQQKTPPVKTEPATSSMEKIFKPHLN